MRKGRKKRALRKSWRDGKYAGRYQPNKRKRCTADGVRIFDSVEELRETLGQGLSGTRSRHFRLVG